MADKQLRRPRHYKSAKPSAKSKWLKRATRHPTGGDEDETFIYGIHAVEAALNNPRRTILELWLSDNAAHRLGSSLAQRSEAFHRCHPTDLDNQLGPGVVHQGALLKTHPLPAVELSTLCGNAHGPIVVLDQVTDPHNVGAVLRSAAAFGAAGLVITRRNSPPLGGALAKTASGAVEVVPVVSVANLAQALGDLNERGVICVGLDSGGEKII